MDVTPIVNKWLGVQNKRVYTEESGSVGNLDIIQMKVVTIDWGISFFSKIN